MARGDHGPGVLPRHGRGPVTCSGKAKRNMGALLKHSKVLRLARGWAWVGAEAEAEQSQDDLRERWGVVGLVM